MLSGVIARLGECGECLMARFAWKPLALHSRCIDPWLQGFTKPETDDANRSSSAFGGIQATQASPPP